jgi:hypothetical protein
MSMSRSLRNAWGLALLTTFAVLPGCDGGGDQASAPPQVSTPPPAVSAEDQKKDAKPVPNEGLSSSSGGADSLAPK